MKQVYDVVEVLYHNCPVCRKAHLLYLFPSFTSGPELWFVSSNKDLLLSDPQFPKEYFSGNKYRLGGAYGPPSGLLAASLCLVDIPNRVLVLSAELFLVCPLEAHQEHSPHFYWHQLIDDGLGDNPF